LEWGEEFDLVEAKKEIDRAPIDVSGWNIFGHIVELLRSAVASRGGRPPGRRHRLAI
jgi:hypothetical protein